MGHYRINPVEGLYRPFFEFEANGLGKPSTFRMDMKELATFVTGISMHNGMWLMLNQWHALAVEVMEEGKPPVVVLMKVDSMFTPSKVRFSKLEVEEVETGHAQPMGAEMFLTVASLVYPIANEFFWNGIDQWEDDDAEGYIIIGEVACHLLSQENPWKGLLFSNRQYVTDPKDEDRLVAESWTFMDGSTLYLTEQGAKTEAEYAEFAVKNLNCGYFDDDFERWVPSVAQH